MKQIAGGGVTIIFVIVILIFITLLLKQSHIETINVGPSQLIKPEDVGLSLVPYDDSVQNAVNIFFKDSVSGRRFDSRFNIMINKSLDIVDLQNSNNPHRTFSDRLDYKDHHNLCKYSSRNLVKDLSKKWYDSSVSISQLESSEVLIKQFLPHIIKLSNVTPQIIHFSGAVVPVIRSIQSISHQDMSRSGYEGPIRSDHDYRIFIIQTEGEDDELTEFITKINGIKADKFIDDNLQLFHHSLEKVNLKIDKQKYAAIVFDNYKIFHKTPDIESFYSYFFKLAPKRIVVQFRVSWDDKDQVCYPKIGTKSKKKTKKKKTKKKKKKTKKKK